MHQLYDVPTPVEPATLVQQLYCTHLPVCCSILFNSKSKVLIENMLSKGDNSLDVHSYVWHMYFHFEIQ
jgi:hypothetical protein